MNRGQSSFAPLAASAFAVFIGTLVLVGWALDLPLLKSAAPGWTALSASRLPCGAARYPINGSDAQTLFQHATLAAGGEIAASDSPSATDANRTRVDGAAS